MKLAVIPARGGSKRIAKKNIRPFCGKPIMAYSILAALESGVFDRVIVSTDCEDIAVVARDYGAEVPFIRPGELADDYCGVVAVIEHALSWFQQQGQDVAAVCGIYATAPMIAAEDIRQGYSLLGHKGVDRVLTVTSFPAPIQRALKINAEGNLSMFQPEHAMTRSQDLEPAYHDAAHFFWRLNKPLREGGPVEKALVIPRQRVQDIDTEEDWLVAEQLFKLAGGGG